MPGRCLALVELYVAGCLPAAGRPGQAPRAVLQALLQGRVPWADQRLVAAFARYKGPYPLGSVIRLEPGLLAVVVSADRERGRQRPTVVQIRQDGRSGEVIDLAAHPERRIVGTPAPAEARFSPARLLSGG